MKAHYPQQFKQLEMMKNKYTPENLLKETLGKQTPEQRKQLYEYAKKFGYSDNYINQVEQILNS